ncbi:hypothetical protein [Cohnella thermotolerans]|jgi:hypothetical protein|uniref:hypothetical protein n=1 Tax=Cohnella thermotolerans TaxID=329858 RepID=UPI00047A458A|nr:hypothetical protein [Cohnella thermotolerans]
MVNKNKLSVAILLGIVTFGLLLLFLYNREKPIEGPAILNKEIASNEVVKVNMTKWILDGVTWKQEDVNLSQEEINQIRSWINSVPTNRIREVQVVNPNISAGIVFELKSNAEIRIQYDKKDIYITRNDLNSDYKQTKYVVEGTQLNDFFENKMNRSF